MFAQSCLALESVSIMVPAFHAAELLEGRKTLIYRAFTISVEVVEIYIQKSLRGKIGQIFYIEKLLLPTCTTSTHTPSDAQNEWVIW